MSEKDLVLYLTTTLENLNIKFDKEVYVRSYIADIVINDKVAIEAKLSDINKAFYQCTAYSSRYKHVYLYMPLSKENLVKKHKKKLQQLGIRWFFLREDKTFKFGDKRWEKTLFV